MRGFFSNILWETGDAARGKSHDIVGDLVPLEFLTFKLVHAEPPAIHQLQFPALVPGGEPLLYNSWYSLSISPSWRQQFALCPSFPEDPRRVADFSI